jgi:predicted nucleic acid-binding protein
LNRFVLDANVAAKWLPLFHHEPLTLEAKKISQEWLAGNIYLYVPDLFWPELANILWKSAKMGFCQPQEAEAALQAIQDQNLSTISSTTLVNRALTIATKYNRTAYDSIYVSLAVHLNAQLITADEKLANALAAYFPIKWLGAL